MSKKIEGIYTVSVTPFKNDGSFDIPAAKKHLDQLIENGIPGICVLGATGEYQSVNNDEHKTYLKEIVPYLKGRTSVIVGASRERPEDVIDLMQNALECGADAAMVLPPFYCHPSQDEIYAHYKYISDHCDLPIIVYNNPASAGVDIAEQTMLDILGLPTVCALKESSGSIQRLTRVIQLAPPNVSILCGCDNLALESFLMGAKGWISMAANFAPLDCLALFKAAKEGEMAKAQEIYRRLMPALCLLEDVDKPAATIKYILKKNRGIDMGFMRRPRTELAEQEKNHVESTMDFDSIK